MGTQACCPVTRVRGTPWWALNGWLASNRTRAPISARPCNIFRFACCCCCVAVAVVAAGGVLLLLLATVCCSVALWKGDVQLNVYVYFTGLPAIPDNTSDHAERHGLDLDRPLVVHHQAPQKVAEELALRRVLCVRLHVVQVVQQLELQALIVVADNVQYLIAGEDGKWDRVRPGCAQVPAPG